jgi:hypothetical protein
MDSCRACKSPIEPGASKCPHCLAWQSRLLPDPQSPRGVVVLLAPFLMFIVLLVIFTSSKLEIVGPQLADFEIVESEMSFSECCGGNHFIGVVGRLRNSGGVSGKAPHFEASFYNADGELVDSVADHSYSLIIAPQDEATFRVRGAAQRPEAEYDSYKVRITAIRQDRGF